MKKTSKRILNLLMACIMITILLPQNAFVASAATKATVYEYTSMVEDNGNIYYIQSLEGDVTTYDIYRLEVATGNTTKLLSSKNDILNMMIHNDTLYYVSYDSEKVGYKTYSISIDGKDNKALFNGSAVCLDDTSIYYTVIKGEKSKLYKRGYDSSKSTLIFTGNLYFGFVKHVDDTLYFAQYNDASSKLVIYTLLPEQSKLTALTTNKIKLETMDLYPQVSDIVELNGDIYYQYGTYQGTGRYWYGTIIKYDTDANKKTVIAKQSYEEKIYHNVNSIFYNGTDNEEVHYQYNTKTGKTSSYTYKTAGNESFHIIGDKTYCAKADGKEFVTVSCFTTGTNKENMVKSFISISCKQKKNYDYSAYVKECGDYLLIRVKCMDFNDQSYGWRGKCLGITWYVADTDGKILAQFK